MATILAKLLEGKITSEDVISALAFGNKSVETEPGKLLSGENLFTEFVPFLLNYLRDKTSCHLNSRQSTPSPLKKCPTQSKTPKDSTSGRNEHYQGQKNCVRGSLFTQKTPSPLQVSHNKKDMNRFASPSSSPRARRKSPAYRGAHDDRHHSQSLHDSKINLDNPEDFPPVGSSTPSNKGRTPRRIMPTPVKEEQNKRRGSPSPFSSGSFVTSPLALENQGSPFQEERNMIKMIRSKRRSKGESPWGLRTSPSPAAGVKTPPLPVFGDFLATSSPRGFSANSPNSSEEQSHAGKSETFSMCSVEESSLDTKDKQEPGEKEADVSLVIVSKELVRHKEKLQVLAKVYSNCITENLVPNLTAELYFVVQLLTAKGRRQMLNQEHNEVREEAQKSKTVEQPDNMEQNIFASIHNCVFFAAIVLEKLERIVSLLDKGTLHLLADNPRVTEFLPALQQQFQKQYKATLTVKPPELSIKSPLGGVPFSAERDNKQNYPSDKAFHNFRKQRDAFYELVREWEDCRTKPGWSVEESMGTRIRSVVHQQQALANHAHLARLFQSQLLQMCRGEGEPGTADSADLLSSLRKSNPEKFQRLRERLVTPMSSGGPCPAPSFSGPQEFFKSFIVSAASHSFSRHLMDLLIIKIIQLNDSEFPMTDIKEDRSIPNQEVQQRFSSCLLTLRILAKFLGFLVFEPYRSTRTSPELKEMRNKVPVQFDVLSYIRSSYRAGRLVLTVPWVVEYLSMMDPVAPHLDYYVQALQALLNVYRSSRLKLSGSEVSCTHLLLIVCLGWLFETPALLDSSFFRPVPGLEAADIEGNSDTERNVTLDLSGFVDQHVLYSCCPYLGEIRSVLAEAAAGMSSRAAGPVKKIIPVCADEPTKPSSSHRHLQLQLEENFFRIQPEFLKRLSDFVMDRLSSNILHHIKGTIIPALLEKGAKQIQAFLEADFPIGTSGHQAKDKCRPRALEIIHSMTDEGVKRATESVESCSKESIDAFRSLCPKDMNYKVIKTAAAISTRLIKEKTTDWIKISLPNIVEKELFTQFDKIVNSILSRRAREERDSVNKTQGDAQELNQSRTVKTVGEPTTASLTSSSCKPADSPDCLLTLVRAMQKTLSRQSSLLTEKSSEDTQDEVKEALSTAQEFFCRDEQGLFRHNEAVLAAQISIELAFILACRTCYGVKLPSRFEEDSVLTRLFNLWRHMRDRHVPLPFCSLLSAPHLQLISTSENTKAVWAALTVLFVSLMDCELVHPDALDSCLVTVIEQAKDEETQENVAKLACHVVCCYYNKKNETETKSSGSACPTGNSTGASHFSLLLAVLVQRLPNNDTVKGLLGECAKTTAGQVVLA